MLRSQIVVLLLAGSLSAQQLDLAFEEERARAVAADAIANSHDASAPAPTPSPGQNCSECGGDGKLEVQDGATLRTFDCGACNGTGKVIGVSVPRGRVSPASRPEAPRYMDPATKVVSQKPRTKAALKVYQAEEPNEWVLDMATGDRLAIEQNKLVLMYFTSYSCPPCDALDARVMDQLDEKVWSAFVPVKIYIEDVPEANGKRDFILKNWANRFPEIYVCDPILDRRSKLPDPSTITLDNFKAALVGIGKRFVQERREEVLLNGQQSGADCGCSRTGVCNCGPECTCPNCPKHSANPARGVKIQLAQWSGGSAGGVFQFQQAPVYTYSPQPQYYSAAPSGGSTGGSYAPQMYAPQQSYAYSQPYYSPQPVVRQYWPQAGVSIGGGGVSVGVQRSGRMVCDPNTGYCYYQ